MYTKYSKKPANKKVERLTLIQKLYLKRTAPDVQFSTCTVFLSNVLA